MRRRRVFLNCLTVLLNFKQMLVSFSNIFLISSKNRFVKKIHLSSPRQADKCKKTLRMARVLYVSFMAKNLRGGYGGVNVGGEEDSFSWLDCHHRLRSISSTRSASSFSWQSTVTIVSDPSVPSDQRPPAPRALLLISGARMKYLE